MQFKLVVLSLGAVLVFTQAQGSNLGSSDKYVIPGPKVMAAFEKCGLNVLTKEVCADENGGYSRCDATADAEHFRDDFNVGSQIGKNYKARLKQADYEDRASIAAGLMMGHKCIYSELGLADHFEKEMVSDAVCDVDRCEFENEMSNRWVHHIKTPKKALKELGLAQAFSMARCGELCGNKISEQDKQKSEADVRYFSCLTKAILANTNRLTNDQEALSLDDLVKCAESSATGLKQSHAAIKYAGRLQEQLSESSIKNK